MEITVDGEAEPVSVKLGVWLSNTKSRRDKLTAEQLAALAALGTEWAGPAPAAEAAPEPPAPSAALTKRPVRETTRSVRRRCSRGELLVLVRQAVRAALRAGGLRGRLLTTPP
ncbi:hypothetical protein [Streptomyces sp. PpalLS-921]|uniref:hypothetical protein n=1 Tax=Streptomyces sp. PpalLS-921 TaxID=1839772 RepID=UPI00081EE0BA|nr:hypothetical protein GA0115249_10417 [Streptomyces sp. PpalLS-921]